MLVPVVSVLPFGSKRTLFGPALWSWSWTQPGAVGLRQPLSVSLYQQRALQSGRGRKDAVVPPAAVSHVLWSNQGPEGPSSVHRNGEGSPGPEMSTSSSLFLFGCSSHTLSSRVCSSALWDPPPRLQGPHWLSLILREGSCPLSCCF